MYSEIKKVVQIFDNNKISYWVFGGIAIECLRGGLTRGHSDIDVLINSKNKQGLVNVLVDEGFNLKYKSENFYRARNDNFQIDILFFSQKENSIVVDGLKARMEIPAIFFRKNVFGSLEELKLRMAPMEFILRTLPYYDYEEDRNFLIDLSREFDIGKIMRVKDFCKRDVSNPKLKLIEKRKKELKEKYNIEIN